MINTFRKEVIDILQNNILSYWIDKMVDPRGGFYGRRDGLDRLDEKAPKGAILNARILWSFSAAYRVLRKPEYLEMATRAKREIIDRFYDKEFGGIYWSLTAEGQPLDTKKQFYAIGFAIYGLSEYCRTTGDQESLDYAIKLFHDIELHSRDRQKGGYLEATTRDWQPIADMRLSDKDANSSKTMNTHLHIIEPYTNLLRVWRSDELLEATESLLNLFLDTIESPASNGHLGLFFDNDWNRQDRMLSFGHDIEASWLLLETAQVINKPELLTKALSHTERIAHAGLEGRCSDGSMIYERHDSGEYDKDKHWWVQAECVIGQLYLYCFHNHPEMLEQCYQTWQYIVNNLVDPAGEWHWSIKAATNTVNTDDDKAGFWKCPYHNSRMCLEVYERLGELSSEQGKP
jgi:mannobiose 2-epimerase